MMQPSIALQQLPLTLRSDRRPLRVAITEALRIAMQEGRLLPGSRLPSTRDFARQLRVARGTVLRAYAQLADQGYLHGAPRAGTLVGDIRHTSSASCAHPPNPGPPPARGG